MKTALCGIVSAAVLILPLAAFASNPAPGVQIIVKKGSVTAFQGTTDATGRFVTPVLEPGVYLFEVRGPKIVGATRYFLALAGARPIGEAMTTGGNLGMQAEVRKVTSVRGQVRAPRVMRLAAPPSTTADASQSSAAPFPSGGVSAIQPPVMVATPSRSVSPQTPASRTTPSNVTTAAARSDLPPNQRTSSVAPRAGALRQSSPASTPSGNVSVAGSPNPQPRIIGGKRYVWVPITSGSNLGRWVLDKRQPAPPTTAPRTSPSPLPQSRGTR